MTVYYYITMAFAIFAHAHAHNTKLTRTVGRKFVIAAAAIMLVERIGLRNGVGGTACNHRDHPPPWAVLSSSAS